MTGKLRFIGILLPTAVAVYAISLLLFFHRPGSSVIGFLGLIVSVGLFIDEEAGIASAIIYGFILCIYGIFGRSAAEILFHGFVGVSIIIYLGNLNYTARRRMNKLDQITKPASGSSEGIGSIKLADRSGAYVINYMPSAGNQGVAAMSEDAEDLDKLRYKLEYDRFLWEKETHRESNSVINRNFGVIITAIVSLAAVTVSCLQLTMNSSNSKDQLELEKVKNDRQFYFEVARFLLDRQQEMTTRDNSKVIYLRNVVISAFPKEVAVQVSSRMRDTASTAELRKVWDDGLAYLNK